MLRIGFCLSYYWPVVGGAERQAHLQAKELVRRGHTVRVITRWLPDAPRQEERDGVQILRWIRPRELGPGFGLTFVGTLCRALWKLRRQLDVVHCFQGLWEPVATGLLLPRLDIPSVVLPAGISDFDQLRRAKGSRWLRRLILRNSQFVALSKQIESELRDLGVPPQRLQRVGNGVDVGRFSPGTSALESRLPKRPRVMFLGRLHPVKNLAALLHAWRQVSSQHPTASLLLVGDGPQRKPLQQLAADLGCAASVHFCGPTEDPVDYLQAADLFVLPSLTEGLSNALLEAMSCGLPVVASRRGGNVDVVQQGYSGLLVEPANPEELAAAMLRLLGDPTLRSTCGQAARQLICREFSIDSVVDRYLEIYRRLVDR